ncbi:RHTO0S02e10902g1_1 [Rhodotorula toruloides]|uniref:RHTO0S02e10902g1_1 n=2 Tax=Rhodotorula toruloides TaxID=5286 RepID=A0A061AJ02_RHOTO|nr:uncharacterized protein RHTO_07292 [Rhodotorula toruloides NP11]EMS23558.1 hypothetical protein RHTO_07292 [Rhodotorula toruloides NP11]CDR37108.1 RHTO0S02e10902g1_1 [Rhodotorula toruloides]
MTVSTCPAPTRDRRGGRKGGGDLLLGLRTLRMVLEGLLGERDFICGGRLASLLDHLFYLAYLAYLALLIRFPLTGIVFGETYARRTS